ncbi:hypothetical protein, conserved [Leishmania tarentolae]|uniref:Uncharacterized protein n=1 Tax=Leishmania tarentolae TaxID=5689 RepID=A0A640KFC4_LEITA|nr:hypothetical protein, conserved [Leishmania tarentolae]
MTRCAANADSSCRPHIHIHARSFFRLPAIPSISKWFPDTPTRFLTTLALPAWQKRVSGKQRSQEQPVHINLLHVCACGRSGVCGEAGRVFPLSCGGCGGGVASSLASPTEVEHRIRAPSYPFLPLPLPLPLPPIGWHCRASRAVGESGGPSNGTPSLCDSQGTNARSCPHVLPFLYAAVDAPHSLSTVRSLTNFPAHMSSAIRFSASDSRCTSHSMEAASAAAEPQLSVSSIPRRLDDQDDPLSLLEPAIQLPTSPTTASGLSQRSLYSGSHAAADVLGKTAGAALPESPPCAEKGSKGDVFSYQPPGNPPTRVSSSLAATVDASSSEARSHSTRGTSGRSRQHDLNPSAPQSRTATEKPPRTYPGHVLANLPWIPPPPIYGTPLPDSHHRNRYHAHYYDPTGGTRHPPFCNPDDVPLPAEQFRGDLSGARWPTPSDLPLPSMFPMPPQVLPQLSLPVAAASAAEAATRDTVVPPPGWPMPAPLLYPPPPPPPPWWFYGQSPPPLSASSSSSSANSMRSSRHASSLSRASGGSPTRPSPHPPAKAVRSKAAQPYAEAAAFSRHSVPAPAGSVETPVVASRRAGTGSSRAANQRSAASSGSRYSVGHTVGTGRATRQPAGSLSGWLAATSTRSATTTTMHSDRQRGVERRVYASSSSGGSNVQRATKGRMVQAASRRTNAVHCVQSDQLQMDDENIAAEKDYSSLTARMEQAVCAAETYLEKMESLYRRLQSRYQEVVTSPGKATRCAPATSADDGTEEKRQRRTVPAATTRATRNPQKKGPLHPSEQAFSQKARLQRTAPISHVNRSVSPERQAAPSSSMAPSLPLSSSSSSSISATSLRRELHLLESQWQRLEELKRHGGGLTTMILTPPVAPSPSTVEASEDEDPFTRHHFLQLIKDRKHLLMSEA